MAELVLKFDPNTIEHLGISLYSKLPSVLSELVSNSWDADAAIVSIDFVDKDSKKEIIYTDDGDGMTFDELNNKYLVIGRNRRQGVTKTTTSKGRKVIGKKGLGKLSVFGICDVIEVISIKDGLKNHFKMDLMEIKESKNTSYNPEIIEHNLTTSKPNGTVLKLKNMRRKSSFSLEEYSIKPIQKISYLWRNGSFSVIK